MFHGGTAQPPNKDGEMPQLRRKVPESKLKAPGRTAKAKARHPVNTTYRDASSKGIRYSEPKIPAFELQIPSFETQIPSFDTQIPSFGVAQSSFEIQIPSFEISDHDGLSPQIKPVPDGLEIQIPSFAISDFGDVPTPVLPAVNLPSSHLSTPQMHGSETQRHDAEATDSQPPHDPNDHRIDRLTVRVPPRTRPPGIDLLRTSTASQRVLVPNQIVIPPSSKESPALTRRSSVVSDSSLTSDTLTTRAFAWAHGTSISEKSDIDQDPNESTRIAHHPPRVDAYGVPMKSRKYAKTDPLFYDPSVAPYSSTALTPKKVWGVPHLTANQTVAPKGAIRDVRVKDVPGGKGWGEQRERLVKERIERERQPVEVDPFGGW